VGGQKYSVTPLPPPPTPQEPEVMPIVTNKGHYMATALSYTGATNGVPNVTIAAYTSVKSEMAANKNLAVEGLKHRYFWNQFENVTPGVYDFSLIGQHLVDCAAMVPSRRLMILIGLTMSQGTDSTSPNVVPKYMIPAGTDKMANIYEGGQWGYTSGVSGATGYRIRLSNTQVQTAFVNMLNALGTYLKAHPNFNLVECVTFTELVVSNALSGYTLPSYVESCDGLLLGANALRTKMPAKLTAVSINHPRSTSTNLGIDYIVPKIELDKIGFGSPDVFQDKADLWSAPNTSGYQEGALHKMQNFNGARLPEIQPQDYLGTNLPGAVPNHQPTFDELFATIK